MKPVLLDTGCIVALLDRSERNHRRCVETVREIDAPLVTCEAVIAEAANRLREKHFRNGTWWVDYRRLRVVAKKVVS